jgi:hypothetical protein
MQLAFTIVLLLLAVNRRHAIAAARSAAAAAAAAAVPRIRTEAACSHDSCLAASAVLEAADVALAATASNSLWAAICRCVCFILS